MAKEFILVKMEKTLKVNGRMTHSMEKEEFIVKTINMKDSYQIIR
jgi:hypothetical protein